MWVYGRKEWLWGVAVTMAVAARGRLVVAADHIGAPVFVYIYAVVRVSYVGVWETVVRLSLIMWIFGLRK